MPVDLRINNPQIEKVELLLFQSGGQLLATRTFDINSLWHGQSGQTQSGLDQMRSFLNPRLADAFAGWLQATPIFRLDILLNLKVEPGPLTHIILANSGDTMLGLVVDQVFEMRRFELTQLELLPPLIELTREREAAWALLRLDEALKFVGADPDLIQAGQVVVVVDFTKLFNQAEQADLETWLRQASAEQGGTQ